MGILTVDEFHPMAGGNFQIIIDEQPAVEIRLSEIRAQQVRDFPGKLREPFSLFFEGGQGVFCPQGNYRLRHAASGWEAEMFIVPVGEVPDGGYRYQAVFN